MAGLKLCLRNKFGYCRYNEACQLKHNNNECEKENCDIKSCDERHPKECWWFKHYNRCKFMFCAYKHTEHQLPSTNLKDKLEALEKKIQEKEIEIDLQEKKVKEIERKQNESHLEARVKNLERFVLKLQEKFEKEESEECDWAKYDPQKNGWHIFDHLVRRKSLEFKCDQCDYVGRNSARLKTHVEVLHTIVCKVCKEDKDYDVTFETEDDLLRHTSLLHENLDKSLTEEEFNSLTLFESSELRRGPDTPRREDAKRKYNLRQKQKHLKV